MITFTDESNDRIVKLLLKLGQGSIIRFTSESKTYEISVGFVEHLDSKLRISGIDDNGLVKEFFRYQAGTFTEATFWEHGFDIQLP